MEREVMEREGVVMEREGSDGWIPQSTYNLPTPQNPLPVPVLY